MPGHYEKALKKKLPAAQAQPTNRTPTTQHKTPHQRSEAKKRGYRDIARIHGSERKTNRKGKGVKGTFMRGSGKAFEKRQKELKKQHMKAHRKRKIKKLVGKITGKKY